MELKNVPTMDGQHFEKEKKEIKYKRVTCHICFGMGVKEIRNGDDTIDCPNRSCDGGYIKVKAEQNE